MRNSPIKSIKNPDKIKNYWIKEKKSVILLTLFGILYDVGMVARPIYQGKLIDALIAKVNFNNLIKLSLTFIFIIGMVQFFRYLKRYYVRQFANATTATMRFMIYNNILHKEEKELNDENMGSLMTKAISDVDVCVEGMRKSTTEVFDTGVLFITYLVTLLQYDVKITLYACIFIPAAVFIAEKMKKIIFKFTKAYRSQLSQVSDITYDRIDNAILYRLYGREADNRVVYEEELEDFEKKAIVANIWENAMQPIYNVIAMGGIVFVIIMAGEKVYEGSFTVGVFSAYISIFTIMAAKASRIARLFNTIQKSSVSWKRIKSFLKGYKEIDKTRGIISKETKLEIENLYLKYDKSSDYIIKNLNFKARENNIVGITGPIGCGKSTLGRVFLGNINYEGSIKIDNKELRDYSEYERSKIISYMGHDAHLISDTIYNNITMGDDGDISHVLKMVCFDEDLKSMENGIETLVGNGGVRLSGGQQARIALARTLYHKNKILILDDPFSAVDMKTEKNIIDNLRANYGDCLILLISHRLAIFKYLNQIILINEDKTLEYGNHQKLIENSKLYNQLYLLQQRKESD
ncbi:MAG: ABC transporter ATP-binding protein [Clostridiales bacterium]|uniref:ABC transporter ATP-binding protein n=1 Tax=Terrisporobacter sp. TaxID=1965305 RepID=UPI002A41A42D|nr:ABC transporter ATP-binding protein [Terrisporobacter sp.]MDD5878834.1 ABC transporter ATP-binding protein [Clostridiales bacterium]MDD7753750.1 ABC transporter ATP-binding protein [Clostridiales bacterium]MDY4135578.1 ABC transporter ATP-binding protein [Terrisporobacter sp.]